MTQEALKLALEALEVATTPLAKDRQEVLRAITAIKEALAQTQEPVHNVQSNGRHSPLLTHMMNKQATPPQRTEPKIGCVNHDCDKCKAQRTWVGLTEDERDHLAGLHLYAVKGQVEAWIEGVDDFAQAIEAKLKEKNT